MVGVRGMMVPDSERGEVGKRESLKDRQGQMKWEL